MLREKKVCGILTEMELEMDEISYVVIGVGLNVNREDFPEELSGMATSLFRETGEKTVRRRRCWRTLSKSFLCGIPVFKRAEFCLF